MSPDTSTPSEPEVQDPAASREHFSASIRMDHWLSLLTVTVTVLLLFTMVAVAVRLLSAISHTVLLFSLGGLLAYALDPLVERVRRPYPDAPPRMSRGISVMLVFLGFLIILSAAVASMSHTLARQINRLSGEHAEYELRARDKLRQTDEWLAQRNIHVRVSDYIDHPPESVRTFGRSFAQDTLKIFSEASKDVVEAFVVALIAVYFLVCSEEMRDSMQRSLPPRLRAYFDPWRDDTNHILGGFVRGQLIIALIMGAAAAIICLLFGLHLWLIIGLFVVIASLIPVFGPVIGAIPAVIGVMLMPSPYMGVRVVLIVVLFVVMNETGSKVLYPRLVGGALGLHEVLVLFVLLAGLEVAHIVGVLFAAPITALAYTSIVHLYRLWQGIPPARISSEAPRRIARQAPAE